MAHNADTVSAANNPCYSLCSWHADTSEIFKVYAIGDERTRYVRDPFVGSDPRRGRSRDCQFLIVFVREPDPLTASTGAVRSLLLVAKSKKCSGIIWFINGGITLGRCFLRLGARACVNIISSLDVGFPEFYTAGGVIADPSFSWGRCWHGWSTLWLFLRGRLGLLIIIAPGQSQPGPHTRHCVLSDVF